MAVCNLKLSDCYSCLSSGKNLIQLKDKLSYCCIKDAATFRRPIEITYDHLSKCPVEGTASLILASAVGAACILAVVVVVAVLCWRFCKTSAGTQPNEATGLLGTGQTDYGFNFAAAQLVNQSFQASRESFEMITLDEVVVEGGRSATDNQRATSSGFGTKPFRTFV